MRSEKAIKKKIKQLQQSQKQLQQFQKQLQQFQLLAEYFALQGIIDGLKWVLGKVDLTKEGKVSTPPTVRTKAMLANLEKSTTPIITPIGYCDKCKKWFCHHIIKREDGI